MKEADQANEQPRWRKLPTPTRGVFHWFSDAWLGLLCWKNSTIRASYGIAEAEFAVA